MDGNGRWAKKRGLPNNFGHKKGAEVFENISRHCRDIGIPWLTVYAFSTENWRRPKEEVDGVMNLMRSYLKNMVKAKNEHIAVRFIGSRENIEPDLLALMEEAETADVGEVITTVQVAFNYGGRDEIVHAARAFARDCAAGEKRSDALTEEMFSQYLYSNGLPDPELLIRPGGEKRISNYLLWQCAYSEFYFCDTLWPDFDEREFDKALIAYQHRERRFGGVKP